MDGMALPSADEETVMTGNGNKPRDSESRSGGNYSGQFAEAHARKAKPRSAAEPARDEEDEDERLNPARSDGSATGATGDKPAGPSNSA
jgi:hypothetical protein